MSIITPLAILTYPNLFSPRWAKLQKGQERKAGERPRFSATFVFPKGTDISALKKAAADAAVEALGKDKVQRMLRDKELRLPWRDDKFEKYGFPPDTLCWIRCWSFEPPGVVSVYRGPDGKPLRITDPAVVYSGCWVKASLRPYFYDVEQKGINFGLGNIQKVKDGPRMDGRVNAEDEFEATEDAPANLADLEAPTGTARPPSGGKDDLQDLLG